jgi:streptogramin lyase
LLVALCIVAKSALAQTVTDFSDGITPGAKPFAIVTGPDGNLWFTESGTGRIGRITPSGTVTEFSAGITPGAKLGEIAAGPDGNLWFTEPNTNGIGRITPNGVVTEFTAGLGTAQPFGITLGPDNNLWFTDQASNRVGRVTPQGAVTLYADRFDPKFLPYGITTGPDGLLWVTTRLAPGNKPIYPALVFAMDLDGNIAKTFNAPAFLAGNITVGPAGDLWYTTSGLGSAWIATRMTVDGGLTQVQTYGSAAGIAKGPDGNMWLVGGTGARPLADDRITRVTPSGVATEFYFGAVGSPFRIAAGADGNLWFTKESGARIGRITPQGVITEFNAAIAPGDWALDIAKGPGGRMWFAKLSNRIGWIAPDGEAADIALPEGSFPENIASGPEGNLWYTKNSGGSVGRMTPEGVVTEFTSGISPGALPRAIVAGSDGNLWYTDVFDRIGRVSTSGAITEFTAGITPGSGPYNIAAGADGNVWFTEQQANRIGRITPAGVIAEFSAGPDDRFLTIAITTGPDGNVWFSAHNYSTSTARVGSMSPAGVVVHFDLTNVGTIDGIASGSDGNLWFSDPGNDRVGRITLQGVVTLYPTGSPGVPTRVTAGPDGNLWFTQSNGDRIGKITPETRAVEFYSASFDHYFMTWKPEEIAKLDAGTQIKGWTRTGQSFKVYTLPQLDTVPTCRFYIPPALGDSHFFGRDVTECNATEDRLAALVLEDRNFMQMYLPAAGVCPSQTTPIYRVFSNRADANHRYMSDRAIRDQMVAKGWLAEGDGPDAVAMCSPQ